jgi:hypothetical protein
VVELYVNAAMAMLVRVPNRLLKVLHFNRRSVRAFIAPSVCRQALDILASRRQRPNSEPGMPCG